jgi:hypothetical protein
MPRIKYGALRPRPQLDVDPGEATTLRVAQVHFAFHTYIDQACSLELPSLKPTGPCRPPASPPSGLRTLRAVGTASYSSDLSSECRARRSLGPVLRRCSTTMLPRRVRWHGAGGASISRLPTAGSDGTPPAECRPCAESNSLRRVPDPAHVPTGAPCTGTEAASRPPRAPLSAVRPRSCRERTTCGALGVATSRARRRSSR